MTGESLNSLATSYLLLLNSTNRTHVYCHGSLILIALHCFPYSLSMVAFYVSLPLLPLYMFSALHRLAICFYLVYLLVRSRDSPVRLP